LSRKNAEFSQSANDSADKRSSKDEFLQMLLDRTPRLRRVIAGLGFGAADADDILQDVSLKAISEPPVYGTKQEAEGWLMKVTINCCMTEFRKRRRFARRASEIAERVETSQNQPAADENAISAEQIDMVQSGLKELDESLLAPLVLKYFCDMNSNEIGNVLALEPSTVRSRLRTARLALAKALTGRGLVK
jgi:RNA polymerase sigma-70 factor (ECF subfamily)